MRGDIYIISLGFEVIKTINNLPYFAGPYLSALLRRLYKHHLKRSFPNDIILNIFPFFKPALMPGDYFNMQLIFSSYRLEEIKTLLSSFNSTILYGGHFLPSETLLLKTCECFISNEDIFTSTPTPLKKELIIKESEAISSGKLTLWFYSPVRLARPPGAKKSSHTFIDPLYLLETSTAWQFIEILLKKIHFLGDESSFHQFKEILTEFHGRIRDIEFRKAFIYWLDIPYGEKTVGGIAGRVELANVSRELLPLFMLGQYVGAGRNSAFGFGFYRIEENPLRQGSNEGIGFPVEKLYEKPFETLSLRHIKSLILLPEKIYLPEQGYQGIHLLTDELDAFYTSLSYKNKSFVCSAILGTEIIDKIEKNLKTGISFTLLGENLKRKHPLFLTSFVKRVYVQGPYICIEYHSGVSRKVLWHTIDQIYLIGNSPVTHGLIYQALREGIPVIFLSASGRILGELYPEGFEIPSCMKLQFEKKGDPDFILSFAKEIVGAKIHNSAVLLRRHNINPDHLLSIEREVASASDLETLRGYEGLCGKIYFEKLSEILKDFCFNGRKYHPPEGPVNSMLSFAYTYIYNRLTSLLRAGGLDPRIGFYHTPRGRHFALASDLLEELRHVADRVVLKIINRKEVRPEDLSSSELPREVIKLLVTRLEEILNTESSLYNGLTPYEYMTEMIKKLISSLRGETPYSALRIR